MIMSKIAGYDTHDDGPGFVGIRFCQECNNMLYPKEDKENKVLMYAVSKNQISGEIAYALLTIIVLQINKKINEEFWIVT